MVIVLLNVYYVSLVVIAAQLMSFLTNYALYTLNYP